MIARLVAARISGGTPRARSARARSARCLERPGATAGATRLLCSCSIFVLCLRRYVSVTENNHNLVMTKRSLSEKYRASGAGSAVRIYPKFRPVFSCHSTDHAAMAAHVVLPARRPVGFRGLPCPTASRASGRSARSLSPPSELSCRSRLMQPPTFTRCVMLQTSSSSTEFTEDEVGLDQEPETESPYR